VKDLKVTSHGDTAARADIGAMYDAVDVEPRAQDKSGCDDVSELSQDARIYDWMTWEEIAREASAGSPVVIPIGATEQHGPHLPVSTDWILPTEMARLASNVRPIVAGPALTFGYRSRPGSGGGQNFPGTISLRATTFMALIEDVLSELIRAGFRNFVLYNWHYENAGFVYEPAFLISERHVDVKIVVVENALPPLSEETISKLWPGAFPGLALEHAALIETSLWLSYRANAVRIDQMKDDAPERQALYDVLPIDPSMTSASGVLASPLGATVEKGELLTRLTVEHLLAILDREFPSITNVITSNAQLPATPVGMHE
jgi:creatinine amidohydrolase